MTTVRDVLPPYTTRNVLSDR